MRRPSRRVAGAGLVATAVLWGAVPPLAAQEPRLPDFERRSTEDLAEYADQIRTVLEHRLLAPPAELQERYAELLLEPGTGVARLLERRIFGDRTLIDIGGGGAYYSFTTRSHDYQSESQIQLEGGAFDSGFAGGEVGFVVDLGPRALEQLRPSVEAPPEDLPTELLAAWRLFWEDAELATREQHDAFRARVRALSVEGEKPVSVPGHTYLVRAHREGEYSLLVAFAVAEQDDLGISLVWRVLHEWPVEREPRPEPDSEPDTEADAALEELPAWMLALDPHHLVDVAARIRSITGPRVLEVAESLGKRFRRILRGPDTGVARILHGGEWDHLVDLRGGGGYYSFATLSNDRHGDPDVRLSRGRFQASARGVLMDLGPLPLEELPSGDAPAPAEWPEGRRAAWQRIVTELPHGDEGAFRAAQTELRREGDALGLESSVDALPGHTYLLRSARHGEYDLLVAFTLAEEDRYGYHLVWRVLRRWPVAP